MKLKIISYVAIISQIMLPAAAFAWGKRGHQIVAESAALVVSSEPGAEFMRAHSFDFAYYSNVPDLVWKRPATYEAEKPEHFMDLELFHKAFKERADVAAPFELKRKDFEAMFPELKPKVGRAYWRIREMAAELGRVTTELKSLSESKGKARQALQEKWFLIAGPMAHYVGDLAMPLHLSENYDGQLTGQKGIHHYFEEKMVDQLYPELAVKVHARARSEWAAFKKKNSAKSVLELIEQQAADSVRDIEPLLKLDKGRKRDVSLKEARRYEAMIVRRMVQGALTLAEIYRRNLGWPYDGERFFFFAGEPAFLKPGGEL